LLFAVALVRLPNNAFAFFFMSDRVAR